MSAKQYIPAFLILVLLPCIEAQAQETLAELDLEQAHAALRVAQAEAKRASAELEVGNAELHEARVEYRFAIARKTMGEYPSRSAAIRFELLRHRSATLKESANFNRDPQHLQLAYSRRQMAEIFRNEARYARDNLANLYEQVATVQDQVADVYDQISETRERTAGVHDQIADIKERAADVYEE